MRHRAIVRVAGPPGSGKTTFIEALLGAADSLILAARCVRDDSLRKARETTLRERRRLHRPAPA
jgi:Ni2+-binding GTPase involved in maturation of urease and hydrogenase